MSYYDNSGPSGPTYVPPPPVPRRGRSPWFWVGIGCALLSLLVFGGCAAMVVMVGKKAQDLRKDPLTTPRVVQMMGDVPLYPGYVVNLPLSDQMRIASTAAGIFIGKDKMAIAAFWAPASPETVAGWYDKKLAGWQQTNIQAQRYGDKNLNITHSRQYVKGDTQVQIQVGPVAGLQDRSNLVIIVMRGMLK